MSSSKAAGHRPHSGGHRRRGTMEVASEGQLAGGAVGGRACGR
jgi:hypothetical protein